MKKEEKEEGWGVPVLRFCTSTGGAYKGKKLKISPEEEELMGEESIPGYRGGLNLRLSEKKSEKRELF